jgi:hypothetical protein
MKRIWLFASWTAATLAVSFLTFQALAAAQSEVNERPLTPVVVAAENDIITSTSSPRPSRGGDNQSISIPSTVSSGRDRESGSSDSDPDTDQAISDAPVNAESPVGSTTTSTPAAPPPPSTTSTSTPGTTSTTTTANTTTSTAAVAWQSRTVSSAGGAVTVDYRPGEVVFRAASPAPGYELAIDETEPEVRVEFENDDLSDYEIRVRWHNGELSVEINEKG